jgi:hypothetical protein
MLRHIQRGAVPMAVETLWTENWPGTVATRSRQRTVGAAMSTGRMKSIVLSAIFLLSTANINAEQYRGAGGQIEAYGSIGGLYIAGIKAAEKCGTYPALRSRAKAVSEIYLRNNKPVYDQATKQIERLAEANGGIKERQRLNDEFRKAYAGLEKELHRQINDLARSERSCQQVLANLEDGLWDLKVKATSELQLLSVVYQQGIDEYPPALIKGILEGCIDGQKRALQQQGLAYTENEDLVRQYCHCMAPLTADIPSTSDGRAKLMDGDQRIKARVQKLEMICLDGLKNGRRFAP